LPLLLGSPPSPVNKKLKLENAEFANLLQRVAVLVRDKADFLSRQLRVDPAFKTC
jgi:hypothetical protein